MRIAIPKEVYPGEKRVALVPSLVPMLQQLGCTVLFENNAGMGAGYDDKQYQGVEFYSDRARLFHDADIVLKVEAPTLEEIAWMKPNTIVIAFLSPSNSRDRALALRDGQISSFGMELIPRITRAQAMDALSSQATAAGYKAALLTANMLPRFFPMLTTAAGTIRPAQVLVIGAGVAGLQAIATCHRLGAIVKAYDIRAAAREQVESLGVKMINIDVKAEAAGGYARELTQEEKEKQQAALSQAIAKSEAVISTASIPGRAAPKIISKAMVELMSPGSLIVDIAAQTGGNCELTQPGQTLEYNGVTIYGPLNLPSLVARDASNMYSKNITNFLTLLLAKKTQPMTIDWSDQIIAESVLTHQGAIKHAPTLQLVEELLV
jgi:NAD(P) transhydrogenase subunit alpha